MNVDQSKYRTYDFLTGRWWQVDPRAEEGGQESWSTYHYSFNNPIRYNDPEGDCGPFCIPIFYAIAEGIAALTTAEVVTGAAVAATGATAYTFKDQIWEAMANASPYQTPAVNSAQQGGGTGSSNASSQAPNQNQNQDQNKKEGGKNGGTFGAKQDTNAPNQNKALNNAKEQNGIPKSQQPDKTIKSGTPEGDKAKLDNRNVKQYEYTNSKGEKVTIRQDKPATYSDGGSQPAHFNAGNSSDDKLKQHHNIIEF